MNIGERLRLVRNKFGLTQPAAASKFNIPVGTLKQYEKGPSEPGAGALRGLAEGGINTNWLLTGEGDMLLADAPQRPELPVAAIDLHEDFALVSLYNVEASAGHGAVVGEEQEISQLAFRKKWLKNKNLRQDKLALIKTRGDSMEPTLSDGDLLLVDTSIEKIIDDAIYVIQTDHQLVVKRLQQSFDGSLAVISDNPRYNQQRLDPEQAIGLKIAGRVCWCCHEM